VYFVLVFIYLPSESEGKYGGLLLAYLFPPAGKESVIPLMLTENKLGPALPEEITVSTIIIFDVITSAILSYSWWFAEIIITHIPLLDRGYNGLQKRAHKFRKKRVLTISLLLFMMIPFQGTGGISTTILARLLGIKPKKTIFIVFIGSTITTTLWVMWWLGFFKFL
jgi:uncharacterized membrane protein